MHRLLVVGLTIGLTAVLFIPGMKSSTGIVEKNNMQKRKNRPEITPEQFFLTSLSGLDSVQSNVIRNWNVQLENSTSIHNNKSWVTSIDSMGYYGLSAYFYEKISERSGRAADWLATSERYAMALNGADNSVSGYIIQHGKKSARNVLVTDPENTRGMTVLAQFLMEEGDDSIMSVVTLLKKVEEKDSSNLSAIYNLALLSARSGQTPKAIERFKKLTHLEPLNPENYFQLGILLEESGQREQAIEQLEICKSLLHSSEQKKIIEDKIKEFSTFK